MSGSEDKRVEWDDVKEQGVRVKAEKVDNQWAPPLYAEEPTLLLDLENEAPITRKQFEDVYGLCNRGPSLKRLKIGRDVTEAKLEKFFGPCNGKNSYRYNYHEDEAVIKEVERLWMICHQRMVVPYNRTINKAEARGFALWKREPSVPVNWCVFAEWTIRNRLRRLQRVEAKKFLGGGISESGRQEPSLDTTGPFCKQEVHILGNQLPIVKMPLPVIRDRAATDDLILEWTELFVALEKELGASDVGMKLLSEGKERCGQELLRCTAQLTDREQLREGASTKLAQIEADLAVLRAQVVDTPEVCFETLPSVVPLLRSFHSHVDMVQTFKEMFEKGERDHAKATDDSNAAEIEWDVAAQKNKVLTRQKVEVQSQLRLLKLGYELPALHPRPPCFARSGSSDFDNCCVISHPCSYCLGPFAPAWDCTISSCRHGYHSWCAKSWFGNNTKCCFIGCGEEMYPAWWALFGLSKPPSTEEESKLLEGILNRLDPITPSTSVSMQKTARWPRSGTLSPSVGSRVLDVKTNLLGPVNPTSPNKKRKKGGNVEGRSDHVDALLPSIDKKRKVAVKKCLSSTVEVDVPELEEGFSEGSSDEESEEDECHQISLGFKDPGLGKRMGGSGGRENRIAANKKKSQSTSSEQKTRTSSLNRQDNELAASDQGVDKPSKSGKKGKTPVSERVSMARTTRHAATKSKPLFLLGNHAGNDVAYRKRQSR